MVAFDATLFTATPRLYRATDAAIDRLLAADARSRRAAGDPAEDDDDPPASDSGRTGSRPPAAPAFLSWGSWIGSDRDGNPNVTAEVTAQALRIQADHLLHGYEAVANRLMQTVAAEVPPGRLAHPLEARLARDADDLPETMRMLRRRFPDEPYRVRLGAIAERLRRTRAGLTGGSAPLSGRYGGPSELAHELDELRLGARRRRPGARRLRRAPVVRLAGRHLRVPPREPRHPPAQRRPRGSPEGSPTATARRLGSRAAGRAGRVGARGPRHVPADGRRPATLRRGRLPARDRVVHPRAVGRPGRAGACPPGRLGRARGRRDRRVRPGDAGDRRRAAVRVARRARSRRADPRRPAPRPHLPGPRHGAGRPPGGDARLLRFEQGARVPRGELVALPAPRRRSARPPGVMVSS